MVQAQAKQNYFQAGVEDYRRGLTLRENPYGDPRTGYVPAQEWVKGWLQAKEDDND